MKMRSLLETLRYITSHPLNRYAKLRAIARFVDWQVRSRLSPERVMPWIGESKLVVRRGMTGATGNIYCGLHEFPDMAFLLHCLRAGDVFVDAGANVGSYTVLASAVVGARSLTIEPGENALLSLRRNIDVNRINDRVTVFPCAVGASQGELAFTTGLDTMNRAAVAGEPGVRMVEQRSIDSITEGFAPVMLKMDVEGHEEQVLAGAASLLAMTSLKAIETESNAVGIEKIMTRFGFKRMYYDPFERWLAAEPGAIAASNALYIRDYEFVQTRIRTAEPFRVLDQTL